MKDTLQETDTKAKLRKETLERREAIPLPVRKVKDAAIAERLFALDTFRKSNIVLLYASFRSEVATEGIIRKALDMGKTVLLPKVFAEETTLKLFEIKSLDELKPGYMGIPEPEAVEENLREIESAGVVVVPGAAFDENGSRLGYGKGYYDRLLSLDGPCPALVALAYEEQMLKNIPAEAHDMAVDIIVTDKRTINCKENRHGQEED